MCVLLMNACIYTKLERTVYKCQMYNILTSFGSLIADPTINIQQVILLSKDWPESFGILIPTYQSLLVKA